MLVKELKETIKKYNNEELSKIIVELYKRVPKYKKEDYDIDNFINTIQDTNQTKTKKKDDIKPVDIESVLEEGKFFIECAKAGYYEMPNNVISKNERSKWRFKAKKIIKDACSFEKNTDEGKKASTLLTDLYRLFSHASCYLTFSNWSVFRAINIEQGEFLEIILSRKLDENGNMSKQDVDECLDLLCGEKNPEGSNSELVSAFYNMPKNEELTKLLIDAAKEKALEWKKKYKSSKKYRDEENVNMLCDLIFALYVDTNDYDKGIDFFKNNYEENNREIMLYCLLGELKKYNLIDEWVKVYEQDMDKVKYREGLKNDYSKYKSQS